VKILSRSAALSDAFFASDDSLNLMRALVALKDADFQTLESVWRPSSQMCIAAAVFTAKRFNKYLVLHMEGMPVHNRPHLQRDCGACPPSSALAPHSAVQVPRPGDYGPGERWQGKGDGMRSTGVTGNPTGENKGKTRDSRAL
jgi:hypothetical protein